MKLFDYQKDGVKFVQKSKKVYLAFDMGMGKTLTAIAAMTSISDENILIVAELNEVENSQNFKKEVGEHFPDWEFFNLRKENISSVPYKKSICIANPELLKKLDLV